MSPSTRTRILSASLLWSAVIFVTPPAANAGVILQAPTYVGLNDGLVGYWSFDGQDIATNGAGTSTALDRSGNGSNGTLTNGPARAVGQLGQSLEFDGVDDYVETRESDFFLSPDLGSISVWFRPSGPALSNDNVYFLPPVVANTGGNFGIHRGIVSGSDRIWAFNWDGNADNVGITYNVDEWIHIAWVHSGGVVYAYKNGILVGSAQSGNTSLGGTLQIGSGYDVLKPFFKGHIDDVRIYNRALSADEVKRLYKIGGTLTTKAPTNLGLIGYWRLDEGSGTLAQDSSVSRNNGTLQGSPGPTWTNGRVGKALTFDGNDDFVEILDPFNPTAYTISAWVRPRSTADSSIFVRTTASGPISQWSHQLRINTGVFEHYTFSDDIGPRSVPGVTPLISGQWYHLVATALNNSPIRLFVNGVEEGTPLDAGTLWISGDRYDIGSNSGNGMGFFTGDIDDIHLYNRALSAAEIKTLYESSKQVYVNVSQRNQLTNGLVGYWTFDGQDMAGNTAYDRSGQGNNGTLAGGPVRAAGKVGQAARFDGVDDFVNVPDNNSLDITGPVTLTAWVYASVTDGYRVVVSKYANYVLQLNNGGALRFFNGTIYDDTGGAIPLAQWTHVSVTNDGTNIHFFKNGMLSSTVGSAVFGDANTNPLNIGFFDTGDSSHRWNGKIDEARIYNRALSADEIKRLYNMGR